MDQSNNVPPPVASPNPVQTRSSLRHFISLLLSLCLALFLVDGLISLLDDSLIVFFGVHALTGARALFFFFALVLSVVIYGLMALTPMIPKRWFVPVTLFSPLASLAAVPFFILFYKNYQGVAWGISLVQVLVGVGILFRIKGKQSWKWPLITEAELGVRGFSWANLVLFVTANLFFLLPAILVYSGLCSSFAVNHFSDGFVGLGLRGLTVEARKYENAAGQTVHLYPMAHIGDASFYRKLSQTFPSNSVIMMEGVSDRNNLLTNKVSYKRTATSLGLADQREEFNPNQGEQVMADIDLSEFGPDTIALINVVMLFHARGPTPEAVAQILQYAPPPGVEKKLFEDLLTKRNRHLLKQIESRLSAANTIIVPWGAAHMPEIGRELEKSGFRVKETEEFVVVRFGSKARP